MRAAHPEAFHYFVFGDFLGGQSFFEKFESTVVLCKFLLDLLNST